MDKKSLQKYVADHEKEFRHIKEDAYNVITELTNSQELSKMKEHIEEGGSDVDMCEAIREMIEDGKNEGRIEGKIEGKIEGRMELLKEKIKKKTAKGYSDIEIADMLEEDIAVIQKIMREDED